jgi:hypothetical protein
LTCISVGSSTSNHDSSVPSIGVPYEEGGAVLKKIVTLLVVVLIVYAIVREPTQSANIVSRSVDGLFTVGGAVIDGLFRFLGALIP